jgi:hypothetical protein
MDGDKFQHIFSSNFDTWKNLEFLIYDLIHFIINKNQRGPISTIYVMALGQRKIWHVWHLE